MRIQPSDSGSSRLTGSRADLEIEGGDTRCAFPSGAAHVLIDSSRVKANVLGCGRMVAEKA
jgi:hypothetical protein